ncbi:hypothetical protein SAMN05428966_102368 [Massilia sp. PDC64]|nr:hypothetical protein SAMN05428966_102368 [Massilia sp. PDC64]
MESGGVNGSRPSRETDGEGGFPGKGLGSLSLTIADELALEVALSRHLDQYMTAGVQNVFNDVFSTLG